MSSAVGRLFLTFLCLLTVFLSSPSFSRGQNDTASCPLNFTILSDLIAGSSFRPTNDTCRYIQQGLRLVESAHLRLTSNFLPPASAAESCWSAYQTLIDTLIPNFDIRSSCGFETSWISTGCMNISTRSQFETLIPNSTLDDVVSRCNQSLDDNSPCASCTTSLSSLQANYLTGTSVGNVSDCTAYASIYAAAFANYLGPTDKGTAKCLFLLDFTHSASTGSKRKKVVILAVLISLVVALLLIAIAGFFIVRWRNGRLKKRRRRRGFGRESEPGLGPDLDSIKDSTTLVRYTFEEIKKATRNFSRDNIIGRGGYGNVYRGFLSDGTKVALKRFKNCSASGDVNFAHEVEVIASVRHVNLVSLRGYCIATTQYEGHQRIIVCGLMRNGSLYDHLFGSSGTKLSWPIRQKIALGTARGLAYLHHGAQLMIIHRDIKASNILLDERFEAKVADFGLAKFTPEGMTHLSTRVAGTMGYVAPEYALYGQLTERSDVYSFGVVLLELLSGKKALLVSNEENQNQNQPSLLADWAWSLVREGKALDVVEDGMPEVGTPEVLEKYVLVAVLCSHPQLYARPTMDQVVKMLEMDLTVPSIPERPIPLVADIDDIERSVSSGGSGQLSTPRGFQSFTIEGERTREITKDSSTSKSSHE